MTDDASKLCAAYDQISGRSCRYYAGHGGKHNFARLDHDCRLERELRRELDDLRKGLAKALDLFDASWCPEYGHAPRPEAFEKASELSKLAGREHAAYDELIGSAGRRRTR